MTLSLDPPLLAGQDRPAPDGHTVASTASLAERAASDGVRFLLATFTTLTGKPCAKLVPVAAADAFQADGVGFAGYAAGAMGQQPRDPDIVAIPDIGSYAPLHAVRPGLGIVHCDPHVEGAPYAFAPRVILRAMIERAARTGVELVAGAELEYFLVQRGPDGRIRAEFHFGLVGVLTHGGRQSSRKAAPARNAAARRGEPVVAPLPRSGPPGPVRRSSVNTTRGTHAWPTS